MAINREIYKEYGVLHYKENSLESYERDFVVEEPLKMVVDGISYAVIMRTPGDEISHAAGFCFSEGLIESRQDVRSIEICSGGDENCVLVTLSEERKALVSGQIERGSLLGQTGNGAEAGGATGDLPRHWKRAEDETPIRYEQVYGCVDTFTRNQKHYLRTRGTHAVMLFDAGLRLIAKAEDGGRHNAMDKSIGSLFLENRMNEIRLAVLSSRVSFEMIQKAARAGIPILISMSNPTATAVDLGLRLNMTLICLDRRSGFFVPCGEKRVIGSHESPLKGPEL